MTEPSPQNVGTTGGPDLTPSKALGIAPTPMKPKTTGTTAANEIAGWMIVVGGVVALIGAAVYGTHLDTYDSPAVAMFGAAMSQFGVLLAILGVHAIAVRVRRT